DILFVIDNSGSMSDNQRALADNVSSFFAVFEDAGISDYQLGIITTDRAQLVGSIITDELPDPATEFASQARVGTSGRDVERGIDMASDAIASGADGLIREDGTLSLIFVSDEPDQSITSADALVTQLYALKGDPDKVVVHAVAGDVPGGCFSAEPGLGYDEVVAATGGLFLSICATDWGAALEVIAEGAGGRIDTFPLSEDPYEPSIEVRIDGRPVVDGWTYDAEDNAIHFDEDHVPEGGSAIDVDYTLGSSCER
ncbi:MAG: VWA domain-containing protein, partial [Phycisphaerales bacterium]|nr:VWA domain-containing protein [Phycisphaerales bacterium]